MPPKAKPEDQKPDADTQPGSETATPAPEAGPSGAAAPVEPGATDSPADSGQKPVTAAPPPPPPPPPPMKSAAPPPARPRVLCAIDGASTSIDGIAFATVELDGKPHHLSECLEQAQADRLVRIPGMSIWKGDESTHARTIEDALDRSRATAPAAGMPRPADQSLIRELEEARRANVAIAGELREQRERADRLATENDRLRRENEALKGAGHVASAA
jgi:hypothetical protein